MGTTSSYLEDYRRTSSSTKDSNANVDNYLEFLNKAEGSPDYNTIVGGGKFYDYSKHPDTVGATTKSGPSKAAGKWQITKETYNDIAPKLGITDFSPESQKKIALKLIQDKGALEDIQKGDYQTANAKLGSVWASLPSSPYPQPKRSPEWVEENLKAIMTADNAGIKADEAQPLQVLDRPSLSTSSYLDDYKKKETSSYLKDYITPTKTRTKTSSYPGYVPFEGGPAENIDAVKAFTKSALATGGKMLAASPAMSMGAQGLGTLGTIYGGFPGGVVGAIVGGVGGLIAGEKAVEKLYDEFMPEKFKEFTG
jgi:muramidase (phage lysozyme)